MTSRDIAEYTGKEHDNVRRDIRIMAEELSLSFEEKVEPSTGGRPSKLFLLPKRETLILVSGYSVTMRAKIIDRWQELEAQVSPAVPTTLTGALRLALAQATRVRVGMCLIGILVELDGWFEVATVRDGVKTKLMFQLTDSARAWVAQRHNQNEMSRPFLLPMICEPRDYEYLPEKPPQVDDPTAVAENTAD